MADSIAGTWAAIEGQEFVNDARTLAYLKAGYGPTGLQVTGDCGCPEDIVRPLVGCDDDPYSTPLGDLAPWYDPAHPESADFAGFLVTEFEGLESTYTREVTEVITGGGVLGRLRAAPRTMTWRGYLMGRTCCATAYGLRWLTSVLKQSRCDADCTGETLDLLVCCPPPAEEEPHYDCSVSGSLPAVAQVGEEGAFRTLYRVGLLEGPRITEQRRAGCGSCGCSAMVEVEFSLVAGNPHLYGSPTTLADCVPLLDANRCPTWVKVTNPADCPDEDTCPEPAPCAADPNCPVPSLPIITTILNECICDMYEPETTYFSVPAATYGLNFEGVPIFRIYAGSQPLRATNIRFIENVLGGSCESVAEDPCLYCDSITIRYVPAFATLVIDGVNKRVSIECKGGVVEPGEPYIVGSFSWPTLQCMNYCIAVSVDAFTAATDSCFSMSVVPKEM